MLSSLSQGQVSEECALAAVQFGRAIGVQVNVREVQNLPTIAAVARHIGVDKHNFYNFARRKCGLQSTRPCERISDEKEQKIRELLTDSDLSVQEIADRLHVSRTSVKDRKRSMQRQEMLAASSEVDFKQVEHNCAVHGIVAYSPCPACAAVRAALENRERALAARRARQRMDERR